MLSWNDVLGQESVKTHLTDAAKSGKLSHAYILSGEEGSGKMMLAELFAAAIECSGEGENKPCGSCMSCMQAESRNHPDIIYVTHEKTKISVDDIRDQLVNDIQIKPYQADYKVYIIADAEKMNEQAQNALLKTLEEPPEYAVILLLATNTGAFLPTILSRCVVLPLKPVETGLIKQHLMEKCGVPDYLAGLCASFSCGCIGKALRFARDENFLEAKNEVLHLVKYLDEMSNSEVMDAFANFNSSDRKLPIDDYLDFMSLWFRDILMFKATQDANRLIYAEDFTDIRKEAAKRSFENLNNIILAIDKARVRLNANVYYDVVMELLLLTIKEN